MADDPGRSDREHPSGPRQASSLAALQPHGRLQRRRRDPDHRQGRRLLRLGRARQPLPRRPQRAVLREHRPRPLTRSPRPAPTRPRSSASSRRGPTRTRARSSSPRASPSIAPGDLNRVFFTSGGSESVETALKLARQYHKLTGNPNKTKVIAREVAYHGTTLGALSATGITVAAPAVRAVHARRLPRAEHEPLPPAARLRRREPRRGRRAPDRVRGPRHGRRGDHGAGPERRRLLHAARGLLPARPRDLRRVRRPADLRRGHLRVRPPRLLLRRRALRLPARHHHDGQGPHAARTRRWAR